MGVLGIGHLRHNTAYYLMIVNIVRHQIIFKGKYYKLNCNIKLAYFEKLGFAYIFCSL